MRARRAVGGIAVFAIAVALAGCSDSHDTSRAGATTTTPASSTTSAAVTIAPTAIAPTTWQFGKVRTTCLLIKSPAPFPYPTFLRSGDFGISTIAVVRASDGQVVQILAPRCPPRSRRFRTLLRSPNGHVLATSTDRSGPVPVFQTTDLITGVSYPGIGPKVSPDGTRVATEVEGKRQARIVRQYDAATGRVLSDLVAGYAELGFDWSADGNSLVVALPPGGAKLGGIYVAARDAHALPDLPVMGEPHPDAYTAPAVLANGHVVVFAGPELGQRGSSPASLVDIDLANQSARTVFGDLSAAATQNCAELPVGTTSPVGSAPCGFSDGVATDALGNDVLVTTSYGIWLYDGSSIRNVVPGTGHYGDQANW